MTQSKRPDDVVVECDLPHPPEQVWRAITDQDLLGRWLTPTDLRPEVGARFRLQPATPERDAPMVDCEIIEAVPNRTLRWRQIERDTPSDTTWLQSIVTFELSPHRDGTHLRVVHDQFRQVTAEARPSAANVICLAQRTTRARTPKIVCAHDGLRRAA